MSKRKAKSKKNCAKKTKQTCCICYEEGNVPCRGGHGCTATLCMGCISEMFVRNQDNCPICRRLWFKPDFYKMYTPTTEYQKHWTFSVGMNKVQVRMLPTGQAMVMDHCPIMTDLDKMEEYSQDLGVLCGEISDTEAITMVLTSIDNGEIVLDDKEAWLHIQKQLLAMNIPFVHLEDIYDYFKIQGSHFKEFIKH